MTSKELDKINLKLFVLGEQFLDQVNKERMETIGNFYIREDEGEKHIKFSIEDEDNLMMHFSNIIKKYYRSVPKTQQKQYSSLRILSDSLQLFKRYFLSQSIINCPNIEQICATSYCIAYKLQNVHNNHLNSPKSNFKNNIKKIISNNCFVIGEHNYPEVEKQFMTIINFNLNLESLYDIIESLMIPLREDKNIKFFEFEKEVIQLSKIILSDSQLIFLYEQHILGLCCVLIELQKKNLAFKKYIPDAVLNFLDKNVEKIDEVKQKIKIAIQNRKTKEKIKVTYEQFTEAKRHKNQNFKAPEKIPRSTSINQQTISQKQYENSESISNLHNSNKQNIIQKLNNLIDQSDKIENIDLIETIREKNISNEIELEPDQSSKGQIITGIKEIFKVQIDKQIIQHSDEKMTDSDNLPKEKLFKNVESMTPYDINCQETKNKNQYEERSKKQSFQTKKTNNEKNNQFHEMNEGNKKVDYDQSREKQWKGEREREREGDHEHENRKKYQIYDKKIEGKHRYRDLEPNDLDEGKWDKSKNISRDLDWSDKKEIMRGDKFSQNPEFPNFGKNNVLNFCKYDQQKKSDQESSEDTMNDCS